MTSNQIAYQSMLENKRANITKEQETERHNRAQEYNQLIDVLDNVFSLGAHAAGGSPNITTGLSNQIENLIPDLRVLAEKLWDTISTDAQKEKAGEYYDIFNNLKGKGSEIIKEVGNKFKPITDKIKSTNDRLKNSLKNIFN